MRLCNPPFLHKRNAGTQQNNLLHSVEQKTNNNKNYKPQRKLRVSEPSQKTRIIKKYPNRRLYDTQISCYITLQDIKELVMSYHDFKVIDAKTKEDLTRCTLMQLIAEEETNGNPILTAEILKEFVRFYGDSMQAMMSRFLEHSVKLFMEKRAGLKSPLNSMLGTNKTSQMQQIAEQNMQSFDYEKVTEDLDKQSAQI